MELKAFETIVFIIETVSLFQSRTEIALNN